MDVVLERQGRVGVWTCVGVRARGAGGDRPPPSRSHPSLRASAANADIDPRGRLPPRAARRIFAAMEPRAAEPSASVTELLVASRGGDRAALDRIFPLVYDHLRAVARAQLRRERAGHTLSTTALVHEAYFKLAGPARLDARDRAHFLGVAARAMRQVLVSHARRVRSGKRGGGSAHLDLDAVELAVDERADALVALDEALVRLAEFGPRLAQVVELRFFGGLSEEETAEALDLTARTVRRDWVKARAWLHTALADDARAV